jgi:hypothetical protein
MQHFHASEPTSASNVHPFTSRGVEVVEGARENVRIFPHHSLERQTRSKCEVWVMSNKNAITLFIVDRNLIRWFTHMLHVGSWMNVTEACHTLILGFVCQCTNWGSLARSSSLIYWCVMKIKTCLKYAYTYCEREIKNLFYDFYNALNYQQRVREKLVGWCQKTIIRDTLSWWLIEYFSWLE